MQNIVVVGNGNFKEGLWKNKCKMKGVGKFFLSGKGERKVVSNTGKNALNRISPPPHLYKLENVGEMIKMHNIYP